MKRATFVALAVVLVAAIVIRYRLGAKHDSVEPPPIVKDEPQPKPKPAPSPSPSPSAPKVVDAWVEDPDPFVWPKPPPPKKGEVHAVDATHIMVDRAFLDDVLKDQTTLARSARVIPSVVSGKTLGVRVFGVRPKSALNLFGIKNGDQIETMNGLPLSDPQYALEAYVHLRKSERIFITLTRAGAPVTIHYLLTSVP